MFQAAKDLRESGALGREDNDALEEIRDWFNTHLERPSRLSISSRPNRKAQAISWFRSTASRHIGKMRDFQRILESYGVAVEMIKTRRPGYIVYEDKFQIAAHPFSDTQT